MMENKRNCADCQNQHPDEFRVCSQHNSIVEHDMTLSKDLGKVSQRLAVVEENTKLLPDMAKALEDISTDWTRKKSFVSGMVFVVSGLMYCVYNFGGYIWTVAKSKLGGM
jgi:hypothetical protein